MTKFSNTALRRYEETYSRDREESALQARGRFLRAFPLKHLSDITVDQYVIGHQRPTFCDFVEAKTRAWAAIQGSTAFKFGIYYGKTRSAPYPRYRFTAKFGRTPNAAFRAVKDALLNLVRLGRAGRLDFGAIDANPLSQLFKAKILSLYFPDRFLNVCSDQHLRILADVFHLEANMPASYYQHVLMRTKRSHRITRRWSNPKFMMFLYQTYIRDVEKSRIEHQRQVKAPVPRERPRINFEDIQKQRDAIGKAAEAFALQWEKERLAGAGLGHLIPKIRDFTAKPGYGYDFQSFSSNNEKRCIEVKSVALSHNSSRHRFFLSENEHVVSKSKDNDGSYYFYLVEFDGKGAPKDLHVMNANELYEGAELFAASYYVHLTLLAKEK